MVFTEGSKCEHCHNHEQSRLNSDMCNMANEALKEVSSVIDVLGQPTKVER